jgi:hypothetical protein
MVFSEEVSALSRPSGRPTASSAPRTTRWVCRWTRWSRGLPEETAMVAIEYESAKVFETKASRVCDTHGTSPMRSERPPCRCSQGRFWTRRSRTVIQMGRKV